MAEKNVGRITQIIGAVSVSYTHLIFLDRQFGLSTVFLFLILGILAGGRNAYRLAKQVSSTEEKKDD